MQWFKVEKTFTPNFPEWTIKFGIDENGVVFVPAAMAKIPEEEVYMCTLFDSTVSISHKNHWYVPSSWLAKEFPDTSDLCSSIELKAREIT